MAEGATFAAFPSLAVEPAVAEAAGAVTSASAGAVPELPHAAAANSVPNATNTSMSRGFTSKAYLNLGQETVKTGCAKGKEPDFKRTHVARC